MLYAAYQALSDSFGPWQEAAHWGAAALRPWGRGPLAVPGLRETSAAQIGRAHV